MLQNKKITSFVSIFIASLSLMLAGCDTTSEDSTPRSQTDITIGFQVAGSSSGQSFNMLPQAGDTLRIKGSNGTLVITDIRFIVDDFELELADGECENLESGEEDCEEFEFELFFVDLPLDGDTLKLASSPIEPGLYEELEFEIDDLDIDDDEDQEEQQQKQTLLAQIRSEFPNWPLETSMVISGSFIPNEGETIPFLTFAEAEVEIELEFSPPLELNEETANKLVRVNTDPASWFLRNDGTVINLSEYDFDRTERILEFEQEIENGFETIEVDDDGEDD